MSEDLFRISVVRPPLAPDPRYPPIFLGQESEFQVSLGSAVSDNPDDPREGLEKAAALFLSSLNFASPKPTNPDNVKLDASGKVVDDLETPREITAGSILTDNEGMGEELRKALGVDDLGTLSAWLDPLEKDLKDSIVALRFMGIEQEMGNLALLSRRLRTIEVIRKVAADANFPFNENDLRRYFLRPLLAPTFAELTSILSTAKARAAAEEAATLERIAAEARINDLWKQRRRLDEGLKNLVQLPSSHRKFIDPVPFKPEFSPEALSHLAVANEHLTLVRNLANLTLKSFERGLSVQEETPRLATNIDGGGTAALTQVAAFSSFTSIASPLVEMSRTLMDGWSQIPKQPQATPAFTTQNLKPFSLLPSALQHFAQVAPDTLALFGQLSIDITNKSIDHSVGRMRQELATNAQALDLEYAPYTSNISKIQNIGALKIQHEKPVSSRWTSIYKAGKDFPSLVDKFPPGMLLPKLPERVKVLGIADLLVVKQQLIGYEKGDIAYIENILKGETKTREVDTLTSAETQVTTEAETTDSKETDTTTAERFEVSHESDKAMKEAESTKAGVTVSASYGPTVSVSANASFASDRSNSEATKEASRYSKDITTKATNKITQRVLQRTVTTTRTETTTKDVHSLTNMPNNQHISGVYQWLNKVYEAQMWNYGKRTMIDVMIPEPGAFFLDKVTNANDASNTLRAVPAFQMRLDELDIDTYGQLGVQYGVSDLDAPPTEMSRATASYATGKDGPQSKADKIAIPAGFQVSGISVTATGVEDVTQMQNWVVVTCGSFQWAWDPKKATIGYVTTETDYGFWTNTDTQAITGQATTSGGAEAGAEAIKLEQTEIPWSVSAARMNNFAVTVELFLERTKEAMKIWQNKTWARLKAASDKIIAEQEAIKEKAQFNSAFQGRNPEINKAIIRNEMKKNCITIMTDRHFDEFGAIQDSITLAVPGYLKMSEINLSRARGQGPIVRFFEEAFEWEEMTWILYPYFWGRKDHWYRRVDYEDSDPEFEKFVQSGFARANVPIRPGFEGAFEYFLAHGQVWMGGPLPGISSELFLPLATEIQESLGKKLEQPVKYGEPWLVKVPTNLVKLRQDDQTPTWKKDIATGEWLEVQDKNIP
ncbi:hypothetical protein BKA64DRAFT_729046 [Cadophora sp. MPI-SDFR-AT-0126]|nr:hypothetical protein BKA64DRAFT_729046 [Leotiomycetes sp. MPI-SDFR-AT-0126]